MENKAKFQPNHLIFAEHQHRPTLEDQRRPPNEVGLKVAQQGYGRTHGVATPMLAYLEPNLARSVHTASPWAVDRMLGRFNVPKGRFAPSIWE